jgi:hypothetical protein
MRLVREHDEKRTLVAPQDKSRPVYQDPTADTHVRMRAAAIAIEYERPALRASAGIVGGSFAERLECAIKQTEASKLIEHEALPKLRIRQPFGPSVVPVGWLGAPVAQAGAPSLPAAKSYINRPAFYVALGTRSPKNVPLMRTSNACLLHNRVDFEHAWGDRDRGTS